MRSMITDAVASTIVAVDEWKSATLTEISRATDKPMSTTQRAVGTLTEADILHRAAPRGRFQFSSRAPRVALRELAEWRLGPERTARIVARVGRRPVPPSIPSTITNAAIRRAWPTAIRSIVSAFDPAKVILFGSQARGDAQPDSDVDLLVIFDRDVHRREQRVAIRQALSDMPFAKDVLVATTGDLQRPMVGSVVASAVRDGLVVYER